MLTALLKLSAVIDAINRLIGKNVAWLILVAVLVSSYNAIIRYLGNSLPLWVPLPRSSNALLELQWYLYGTVFLLASAYTLLTNEHIRIDLVSNRLTKRTRDWIDLVCHSLMLVPFAGLMVWLAVPWFVRSYVSGEVSRNAGGLVIWPAKLMVLVGFSLLLAQAFSEIIKRIGVLAGRLHESDGTHYETSPMVEEMQLRDKYHVKGERRD